MYVLNVTSFACLKIILLLLLLCIQLHLSIIPEPSWSTMYSARFQVLVAAQLRILVFWNVTHCWVSFVPFWRILVPSSSRVRQSQKALEGEGSTILQTIRDHLYSNTASHPRTLESSCTKAVEILLPQATYHILKCEISPCFVPQGEGDVNLNNLKGKFVNFKV
jgi:hypothetical protein